MFIDQHEITGVRSTLEEERDNSSVEFQGYKNTQKMTAVKRTTMAFVLCATLGAVLKITLLPAVAASEPVPDSENFVVSNVASANEKESEPSWEFQRSSFSAEQIVSMVICGLCFSLISIPISMVYHRYLGERHNETGTEHDSSEIRMILQEGERLRLELMTMVALHKDQEDFRHAEYLKEMDSIKRMNKEEEKRYFELQNEVDSTKAMMKVQGVQVAQFQNAMEAAKNMISMDKKRCTKFWDDMNSMKKALERTLSIRKKETVRKSTSKPFKSR